MRTSASIILAILVCVSLLARAVVAAVPAGGSAGSVHEHCACEVTGCDAQDDKGCCADECATPDDCSCAGESGCPVSCHHHHHGACGLFTALAAVELADLNPVPPPPTNLDREQLNLWPPDGPVRELEKPPVI